MRATCLDEAQRTARKPRGVCGAVRGRGWNRRAPFGKGVCREAKGGLGVGKGAVDD